jgi:hypothetical protein
MKELKIDLAHAQLIKQAASYGQVKKALLLANEAIHGHGVESLYPEYPRIVYVNMGDTYSRTLLFNGTSLMIGSWGDYVERHRGVAHDGSNPRNSKYWRR